jgi:outer membrane lipoprotein SlyB
LDAGLTPQFSRKYRRFSVVREAFMLAKWVRHLLLPLMLAAGLGACASNAVQPGIVHTSASTYPGAPATASTPPPTAANAAAIGTTGRVVSIREIGLRGAGGRGGGNGAVMGGVVGAAGGATIGAITSNSVAGGLVGALLGAVGGAIAGTIIEGQRGGAAGPGIEVTVQRDDGGTVTVAQRDDGDVQLGDRVQIVQDRQGVAKAVRDTSRAPD